MLLTRLSPALDSPFARLRVTSEETVDFGGKGDGDDTLWVVTDRTSSVTRLTHASKGKGGSSYALIATREGLAVRRRSSIELAGGETETETEAETVANSDSAWRVTALSPGGLGDGCWHADGVGAGGGGGGGGGVGAGGAGDSVSGAATSPASTPPPPPPTILPVPPTRPAQPLPARPLPAQPLPAQRLQPSQLAAFVRDGCLVLRGLVPATVLFRAQTAVNSRLGRPGGLSLFYDEARKVAALLILTLTQTWPLP